MQQIIQEDLVAKAAAEEKKKKRARTGVRWDRLFMACAYNWYWFVLSMIVCATLAWFLSAMILAKENWWLPCGSHQNKTHSYSDRICINQSPRQQGIHPSHA